MLVVFSYSYIYASEFRKWKERLDLSLYMFSCAFYCLKMLENWRCKECPYVQRKKKERPSRMTGLQTEYPTSASSALNGIRNNKGNA
jgi:hypothetical protein